MPKVLELVGRVYGRLTVLSRVQNSRYGKTRWNCQCSCGKTVVVCSGELQTGHTQSCGCLGKERRAECNTTHGGSNTPEYRVWHSMKRRCYDSKVEKYKYYGGRGITVCKRWLDSFENFITDMGKKPSPKHTIERVDNNKGYSPENCRWATWKEQQNNRRFDGYRLKDKKPGCQSKYIGVARQLGKVKHKLWRAYYQDADGRFKHLGGFVTEEEAAHAHDRAVRERFGDKARLNFVEEYNGDK